MNYWENKTPCWEIKGCMGKPGKGKDCIAYKYTKYPCWNAVGTLCKGPSGRDIRECQCCEVYHKYGQNKPILVFDVAKM
jgi:hypothetical protein